MGLIKLPPPFYSGSVKGCHDLGDETMAFRWTDYTSAFDRGPDERQPIRDKGKNICACAVRSFEIARMLDVPTHFIEQLDEMTIRVKKLGVFPGRVMYESDENYVVPIELIKRYRVSGSIARGFRDGTKEPTDYGFPTDEPPPDGTPFPWPVPQTTTKFEETGDREITEAEALQMAGLSARDLQEFWAMIIRLDGGVALVMRMAGYIHFDGKNEVGLGVGRQKMIVDVYGTGDEDRPVKASEVESGNITYMNCKEGYRQELIRLGFKKEIDAARLAEEDLPSYPLVGDEFLEQLAKGYEDFTKAYTGVSLDGLFS